MTSPLQSQFESNASWNISGMELQSLQAIGKLMAAYTPESHLAAEPLISDDINRLGDMILFLSRSRMYFDEFVDAQFDNKIRAAIEQTKESTKKKK